MRPALVRLPVHMTVFVNWQCNLRCRECWLYGDAAHENTWLEPAIRDELSLELFQGLIDQLLEGQDRTSISLMGGEPLLNRLLPEMIQYLKERSPGSYIDVSTNGTTLHKDAESLLASGIDQIYVSLDGPNAAVNDRLRGKGSFDRAMRGLDHALGLKPQYPHSRVSANFTVTALNFEDLVSVVELCEERGVDELSVNFTMVVNEAEGQSAARRFEPIIGRPFESWRGFLNTEMSEGADVSKIAESIAQAHEMAKTIDFVFSPSRYSAQDRGHYFDPKWKSIVREKTCRRLELQSTLLPNGDVLSCTAFADTVMGNLNKQSLKDIWHGARYQQIREMLNNGGLTEICHRCCDLNMNIEPVLATVE